VQSSDQTELQHRTREITLKHKTHRLQPNVLLTGTHWLLVINISLSYFPLVQPQPRLSSSPKLTTVHHT